MRDRYAHSLQGRTRTDWHPLIIHLEETARLAGQFASAFDAGGWGLLAGLWHDLGKYSDAFQDYLNNTSESNDLTHQSDLTGHVDHSTAGAQRAAKLGLLGRLLAYAIAGHHAGLPDNHGEGSSLSARLEKQVEPIDAAPAHILGQPLPAPPRLRSTCQGFSLAFYTRMLFSCLVDADFLGTEAFMNPPRAGLRPGNHPSCEELLARLNEHLAKKQHDAPDTVVNRQRAEVLTACRSKVRALISS